MILTGKTKEDFVKWYYSDIDRNIMSVTELGYPKNEIVQHALIIEWLDSVKCSGFKSLWAYSFGNSYSPFTDNWNEYIKQAILKANDIYNKRVEL